MLACISTAALSGLEGRLVEVQVDIAHQGLPNFFLVGWPTGAVKEARERVRTAIKNSGMVFPLRRITVNLAPARSTPSLQPWVFQPDPALEMTTVSRIARSG